MFFFPQSHKSRNDLGIVARAFERRPVVWRIAAFEHSGKHGIGVRFGAILSKRLLIIHPGWQRPTFRL